jgi:MYXO-CTERM domain-containing protein
VQINEGFLMRFWNQRSMMVLGATLLALTCTATCRADTATFTGSSGSLSAEADFTYITGSTTLTVVLANTSAAQVTDPSQVLTAIYFNSIGTITPGTAVFGSFWNPNLATPGFTSGTSAAASGTTDTTITNVGDGWGFASTGLNPPPHGFNSEIAGTGAANGGPSDGNFGATNPVPLDGVGYGLVGGNGIGSGANGGITGHGPLIDDSIKFTLTVPTTFSLSELGNTIQFQYGTSLTETNYVGHLHDHETEQSVAPEPSSIVLAAMGALGIAGYGLGRRRRAKKDSATD